MSKRTNERSGASERSEQCEASESVSVESERANGEVIGRVPNATISHALYPMCVGVRGWELGLGRDALDEALGPELDSPTSSSRSS